MTLLTFEQIFGGPIAKGLALTAVVIGVVMRFSGHNRKRKHWGMTLLIGGLLVLAANLVWWIVVTADT